MVRDKLCRLLLGWSRGSVAGVSFFQPNVQYVSLKSGVHALKWGHNLLLCGSRDLNITGVYWDLRDLGIKGLSYTVVVNL